MNGERPQEIAIYYEGSYRRGSVGPLLAQAGRVPFDDEDSYTIIGLESHIAVVFRDRDRLENDVHSGAAVELLERLAKYQVPAIVIDTSPGGLSAEILQWELTAFAARIPVIDAGGRGFRSGAAAEIVGQMLSIAAHFLREGRPASAHAKRLT